MNEFQTFLLDMSECELLLLLESQPNLKEVALAFGRDHSVVSRSIKKIADRYPLVEKKGGKWVVTNVGKTFNEGTRTAIQLQNSALKTRQTLRLGTNREFASRVLGADFLRFQKIFPNIELTINAYQGGVENALLAGQIDLGIDCERPQDPDIAFKIASDEHIVAVASPSFVRLYRTRNEIDWQSWPHLFCERLNPDKILARAENRTRIVARFNDIATTRSICVRGFGWAFLPYYAVYQELQNGELVQISRDIYGKSKYGVWWMRSRSYHKDFAEKVGRWIAQQPLALKRD